MKSYWVTNKLAISILKGLANEGLRGNHFGEDSYSLDNAITIKNKQVYFFAEVYRGENSGSPLVEVGFSLGKLPSENDAVYSDIEKKLEEWKKEKENSLASEVSSLAGVPVTARINHCLHSSVYPTISFKGTDGVALMKQAKEAAAKLVEKDYTLAGWYFKMPTKA